MRRRLSPSETVGIIIAIPLLGIVIWFLVNPGLFSKLSLIVFANYAFMIACVSGFLFACYRRYKDPERFTWLEVPIQAGITCIVLFLFYAVFFYTATDLHDWEFRNSYVERVEYWEEWTEEDEDCDDKGNCTKSRTYHPPEWKIKTAIGDVIATDGETFRNYVSHFGSEIYEDILRIDQVSIGDGDLYYTVYPTNDLSKKVPTAREYRFVNYLKASSSIRKRVGGNTVGYEKYLREYPRGYASAFGPIDVDRVIAAEVSTPDVWKKEVDRKLDMILADLGPVKEVNVLVYLAGTPDQFFLHALEEYWVNGKKNDVIIILGVKEFPQIEWVSIIAWTNVEEFKIELRDRITELETLEGKGGELVGIIGDQIGKPPEKGGFRRIPMSELQYLIGDIVLPWWAQILVIIIAGSIAWGTSWALIHNTVRSGT